MKTSLLKIRFLTLVSMILPLLAPAASLTWDANTAVSGAQDGAGTWDTTTANWWTGSADTLFNNATPDVPTFGAAGGTAGTVTLGANIFPGNITFNAPSVGNYTIAGGGFLLGLTNRTIIANVNATISANIVGTYAYSGTATVPNFGGASPVLTLSGNNSFTNFNLGSSAGNTTTAVRINSSTAFGDSTGQISIAGGQGNQTSHRIELAGSGMTIANSIPSQLGRNNPSAVIVNLGSANIWSGRLTRSTGGADCGIESEVANGLTFSGAASSGFALASGAGAPRNYVLRGTGGGTISGIITNGSAANNTGIVKAGSGTWTLSGANTYTNATIVDEGTLTLDYSAQNNSKLADQSALVLGGGTVNLSGGSHTEVVLATTLGAGNSSVARSGGTSTLRMNAITRSRGGVINFGAASIADTDSPNATGNIFGGYATVAGADWAMNSAGLDGPITAFTGYTNIAASGSTIADFNTSNVRLNSAGGGGNIALGAATTTVNTLLQNTTTAATIDTSTGILRLGAIGGVLLPSTAQSLTIGTAANSGFLTAGGADNTAGEVVLINNSANPVTVNSVITNNGTGIISFTKAGGSSVTLAGANTHTGTNSIVGGTLNVSDDTNFGAVPGAATVGSILINGGVLNAAATFTLNANRGIQVGPASRYGNGTIGVASSQTLTYNGIIANADATGNGPGASLTKTGNGTLVLGGVNTYALGTFINGGTVSISASGNIGPTPGCYIPDHLVLNGGTLEASATLTLGAVRGIFLGPIGGAGTGTFQVDDTVTLQLDSRIADNWNGAGSLAKTGNGTLLVTGGLNDYSGDTTVSAGVLQINNSRSIPNGTGKGNLINNGTLNINGVNVQLNGLTGGGTVDNITGTALTLGVGNNNQGGTFGGTIQNTGGGAIALSKVGGGTLTLTGAANHTGSTLVNSGILSLTGTATIGSTTNIAVGAGTTFNVSGLTGGTLTLNSGQTLSGNGTVLGTINAGGGALAPGASAGTLSVANLTLGGSTLNYELANVTTTGAGVNDYIVVSGTLNVASATTLNVSYLNALPAASGKYTLISYGSFAGDVNNISVPAGFTINNNTVAKTIELLINHTPVSLVWVGDGLANVWDINAAPNWTAGATFFNGDTANFDNTGSAAPAVNVAVPVSPAAVNVSGTQNYTFTGSAISTATLSKSGGSTLTLVNDNTFSVGALISGGTLQIGNGGTTGTLNGGPVTNNAAIVVNRTDGIVITNAISGSGTVTINEATTTAAVSLNASNSYAGLTTVSQGILQALNGAALGTTAAGTVVNNGAQLYVTLNVNVPEEALTLSGSGPATDGALRKGGGGVSIYGGVVTLTGDTMLKLDGNSTLNLTNAAGINGAAANAHLLLAGDGGSAGFVAGPISLGTGGLTNNGGTWTVSAANNYAANTVINGGALRISSPLSLGVTPGAWTPDRVTLNGGGLEVSNNASVALNDGKIGITVTASSQLIVDTGATLTITNEISGTGDLQKWLPGLLVLSGSNSYAGAFFADGASNAANDGTTRLTRSDALANVTAIGMRNNNSGFSTLQLDGSAGNLALPQPMTIACRNNINLCLQNLAGSNVLSGGVSIQVGGSDQWWQSDAGTLVFAGDINYIGTLAGARTYDFLGAGDFLVAGNINASPIGSPISITKSGAGKLTLAGANTYGTATSITNGLLLLTGSISHTGAVTVVGGTLGGTGTITAGAGVNVLAGGRLSPGASIGTLTINNDLTLAGTTVIEVNKTANISDQVVGVQNLSYGGTLYATNLSGTLNVGDSFTVFGAATPSGNFAALTGTPGPGLAWSFHPASGVLSVVTGIANYPTNITATVSGSTLTVSWPTTHLGWILSRQTNDLTVGLSSNWFDVPGSSAVTSMNITINPANPTVFFRLRSP